VHGMCVHGVWVERNCMGCECVQLSECVVCVWGGM